MTTPLPLSLEFILGDDELNEPFHCWTDGSFGLTHHEGLVYAMTPVNDSAADQWIWAGESIDDLVPITPMIGITTHSHQLRGHTYDAGWWPYSLWIDGDGTWHSLMHAEDYHQADTGKTGWGSDLRTIGLWSSFDDGITWSYQGVVVSIDRRFQIPAHLQPTWPRNGGCGDHKLIIDPRREYAYILYTNFTYKQPEDIDTAIGHLAIARAPLANASEPQAWRKWHNGSFSQPADGGSETWIMSPSRGDRDNSQRAITWNTHLGRYLMAFVSRTQEMFITTSSDLIHWTPGQFLYSDARGVNYVNIIGTGAGGTDQVTGQQMWVYYTRSDYEVHRRLLTLDATEHLDAAIATVERSQNYPASSGFTQRQGGNRWSYLYQARLHLETSNYWSPMRWHPDGRWESNGGAARIGRHWQQAQGTECARVWRAPASGRIKIHSNPDLPMKDPCVSTYARIYHNRTQLWPTDRQWMPLRHEEERGADLVLEIKAGDRVYFILRGLQGAAPVRWDPTISFVNAASGTPRLHAHECDL